MSAASADGGATRLTGRPAAGGVGAGPLHRWSAGLDPPKSQEADPLAMDLDGAIAAARSALEAIAGREEPVAAAMIGFQSELLADPSLLRHVRRLVAAGLPADLAWSKAVDAEIDLFLASGSETLAARASDLLDVRGRVLGHLRGTTPRHSAPPGHIVLADDITPSEFLSVDWSGGGLLLRGGSAASHVATLARARGVPMIVGIGPGDAPAATHALIDGDTGVAILEPRAIVPGSASRPPRDPVQGDPAATTADGVRVELMVNISSLDELDGLDAPGCVGIGLVRSEFLLSVPDLLSEERQLAAYRALAAWTGDRPLRIRTLDGGGDKGLEDVVGPPDRAPGLRGLRLSLRRPEVFRVQLRALARAAADCAALSVMLPMVTTPEEFAEARLLLEGEVSDLQRRGTPARMPKLGVMIEVPSAAIAPELFAGAAFFSIGSNDLFQYTMAIPRGDASLAALARLDHPAMGRLIENVAAAGKRLGIDVSVCGDVAGDPQMTGWLLSCGVRSLSLPPRALAAVRASISRSVAGSARPAGGMGAKPGSGG